MRRILEEQIAEKKRRQEEEKKKRNEEDLRLEKTMHGFKDSINPPGDRFGRTQELMPLSATNSTERAAVPRTPVVDKYIAAPPAIPPPLPPRAETPVKAELPARQDQPQQFEETPEREQPKNIAEDDERWETLKSQIQMLNEEKKVLLDQLEDKDKLIKDMASTRYNTHSKLPITKHKVISSADYKKKDERRRKEGLVQDVQFYSSSHPKYRND